MRTYLWPFLCVLAVLAIILGIAWHDSNEYTSCKKQCSVKGFPTALMSSYGCRCCACKVEGKGPVMEDPEKPARGGKR